MQYVQDDIPQKLVAAGLIEPVASTKAMQQQKNVGGSILANLIKIGAIGEGVLLEFMARAYSTASADLANWEPDLNLTKLIPGDVATKFMALPIARVGRRLVVAMANPANLFAIDDIKFITGFEVEPHVAFEPALKKAIDRAYDSAGTMADVMKGMEEDL